MAGRCDEVEQHVNTVVSEARITLDTRFLSKNVVVLTLEIANNLREAVLVSENHSIRYIWISLPCLVVDLIAKARGIDDCQ
jgi:hypothetical protein